MGGVSTKPQSMKVDPTYSIGSNYNTDAAFNRILNGGTIYNLDGGKIGVKSQYKNLMGAATNKLYEEYKINTPPQAALMSYDELKAKRAFNPATFVSNLVFSTPAQDIVSPKVEQLNKLLGN